MKTLPLSPELQPLRDLLATSLIGRSTETAPPAPQELLTDLGRRFSPAAVMAPARTQAVSLFGKLLSMLASPAFGMAAIMMLAIVVVRMTPDATSSTTIRGGAAVSAPAATIVLLTSDPSYHQLLEESGLFDMASVIETSDPLLAAEIAKPKLLIDLESLKMVGYNSQSREVVVNEVPEDRTELLDLILTSLPALE
jgi:hypothetical protein